MRPPAVPDTGTDAAANACADVGADSSTNTFSDACTHTRTNAGADALAHPRACRLCPEHLQRLVCVQRHVRRRLADAFALGCDAGTIWR